jgi:hypothetical protein
LNTKFQSETMLKYLYLPFGDHPWE